MNSLRLAELRALAALREQRSAAGVAKYQVHIDRLEAQAEALRQASRSAPASIGEAEMHDRWNRWRMQQLALLNQQIARLHALAQPRREAHARDRARQTVIGELEKKGMRGGR